MITKIEHTTKAGQKLEIYLGMLGVAIYDATGPVIRTVIADTVATPGSLATALVNIE